ncbi:MAG: NRDE family protein [Spirosomataceae bacterium]
MCFVTYLPYEEGFILTSNRDEHVGRPKAQPPKKYIINGRAVFYPQDGLAGGTWIAASSRATLCLLNGAFVKHTPQPPYRKSRGRVVLDFFTYKTGNDFRQHYDFSGIEPFTLIMVEQNDCLQLTQLRWDGNDLHTVGLEAHASHAWSSVTLYSDGVIQERERWFADWQQQHPYFEGKDIQRFHTFGGKEDAENGLIINRNNELKTVSITQIQKTSEQFLMSYWDRITDHHYDYRIFAGEKIVP